MAKRSAASRRRPTRKTKRTILIVTNGEKTEPQYLNGLKRHLDVRHATVKVRRISGSPQTLIQKLQSPTEIPPNMTKSGSLSTKMAATFAASSARARTITRETTAGLALSPAPVSRFGSSHTTNK